MTKDEILAILGDAVLEDGSLSAHGEAYSIWWHPTAPLPCPPVVLDGCFSADDLEAIAAHMRAHGAK